MIDGSIVTRVFSQRLVAGITGLKPRRTVDPDKAVALGAAVYAGILEGEVRTRHSFGHLDGVVASDERVAINITVMVEARLSRDVFAYRRWLSVSLLFRNINKYIYFFVCIFSQIKRASNATGSSSFTFIAGTRYPTKRSLYPIPEAVANLLRH